MARTPATMYRNIRTWAFEQTHPLSLLVDPMRNVQVCVGDLLHYGYRPFNVGEDCTDQMPFLFGLDFSEPIELQFVETPNGNATHVQVLPLSGSTQIIFFDATEQKGLQVKMQQKANELYLLHQEQTKTMEAMRILEADLERKNREAEKANQLKSRFIANMSHEFRTPLTGILGFTELIQKEIHDRAKYSEYITAVEQSAKHLLSLVENLLDQAQIETSSVEIHAVKTPLKELFAEIGAGFISLAKSRGIEFEVNTIRLPDVVNIDDLRLRQIIVNLVGNAIKFTSHGSVSLTASWTDGKLTVSVKDTGDGIAEKHQEKIFEAFEKLENQPGSGLGLSIVKHLVAKMDGSICLESREGLGSRFEVILPAPNIGLSNTSQVVEAPIQTDIKILCKLLVIEDNPDIMLLLRTVLENVGCDIIQSVDGLDGVNQALTENPDVVLMDLNLPILSGFGATRKLRSGGFTKPIIALSASTSANHKQQALEAGCNEYVIKPFDIPYLLQKIQQFVVAPADTETAKQRREELNARFQTSLTDKLARLEGLANRLRCEQWSVDMAKEMRLFAHNLAGSAGLYGYYEISNVSKRVDNYIYDFIRTSEPMNDEQVSHVTDILEELTDLLKKAAIGNEPD